MAATAPTAAQVGKAFVSQYYNVLHATPHVAHRFYIDGSTVTRTEFGANGVADTVSTQAEIHQKLVSFKYEECKAEIKTVDSQQSLNGSVFVMVTGSLTKNNSKRNFVQTFFLAPQENGFYVLNDMYRFFDDEPQMIKHMYEVPSPGLETASEIHLDDHHEDEERDLSPSSPEEVIIAEDAYDMADNTEISEPEDLPASEEHTCEEIIESITKEQEPTPPEAEATAASAEHASKEKKSYASIVSYASILLVKKECVASTAPLAVVPSRQEKAKIQQPPNQPVSSSKLPISIQTSSDKVDENIQSDTQVDQRSVYVRNLPLYITPAQLEVEFMRFGPVKSNSVNVRSQRQGPCYGFVEFEDSSSAQAAIEASPIYIFGRPAYAEEKRALPGRASGTFVRGGDSQGRGTFQNGGGRGRSSYGRLFVREIVQNHDFRGRGPGHMRGNYRGPSSNYNYIGNASNFNGYRRPDSQGVNANRPLHRGPPIWNMPAVGT